MSLSSDRDLIQRVRRGDEVAWKQLISEYDGRLLAFVISRISERSLAEDLVQETFLGFLTSLPNYDDTRSLESFLFTIAAYKVADALRRQGRRPTFRFGAADSGDASEAVDRRARRASSFARSREQEQLQETIVVGCLQKLIQQWKQTGELERLKCVELLLVKGFTNKDAALELNISEQAVANHKHFVVGKLKAAAADSGNSDLDLRLSE
ncbi:RNA polymerase sigma factor [Planctomicrobium sp. SH527]|uniref:RNA polymerase sigma factor n=1 Tax=Planctomicrobium sp. SH527 TaxID=3448123 RepID=UPI003F5B57A6